MLFIEFFANEGTDLIDRLKWVAVLLIVIALVVGNAYFSQYSLSIRVAAMIIAGIVALLIAKSTQKGERAWAFILETRIEMRKVVWPTRQETVQTTMVVIAIVVVMSLILWGVDSLFALLISNIVM
ncbi:MAG: preprotein translocase subunit SecE [Gammaproteobacteria bacterium]|nr:preprotein translocase subunit SecE [Gammaproteobacteria bacterium]